MAFSLWTHDAWGVVKVGMFETLAEARQAFAELAQDPWYKADGTVRGVELRNDAEPSGMQRLDWIAF